MILDMGESKRCSIRFMGEEFILDIEMGEEDKESLTAAYEAYNYLCSLKNQINSEIEE